MITEGACAQSCPPPKIKMAKRSRAQGMGNCNRSKTICERFVHLFPIHVPSGFQAPAGRHVSSPIAAVQIKCHGIRWRSRGSFTPNSSKFALDNVAPPVHIHTMTKELEMSAV